LELLEELSGKLPDLYDLQRALQKGSSPGSVGNRLWMAIQSYALESAAQAEQRIQKLEPELRNLQSDRNFWKNIAERNQADTLRQKLDQAQQQLQEQSVLAEQAEQEISTLSKTLERERRHHQAELIRCEQTLAEQTQIIADQHHKLERLLGMDSPPTNRA